MEFSVVDYLLSIAVYMLIKHMNKDFPIGNKEEQFEEESLILSYENDVVSETVNLDEVRKQSASSINNRHKEAAEIVREAMENINDNPEVISEHKKEFDSILDDFRCVIRREVNNERTCHKNI